MTKKTGNKKVMEVKENTYTPMSFFHDLAKKSWNSIDFFFCWYKVFVNLDLNTNMFWIVRYWWLGKNLKIEVKIKTRKKNLFKVFLSITHMQIYIHTNFPHNFTNTYKKLPFPNWDFSNIDNRSSSCFLFIWCVQKYAWLMQKCV